MSTRPLSAASRQAPLLNGIRNQARVVGALLLREIQTRYGRDNIGYIWLIAEPLIFATVVGIIRSGERTSYGSDIPMMPMSLLGYVIFILFRNMVNRSEGAIEANASLLYHKMVTPEDITLVRALMETLGTGSALIIVLSFMVSIGLIGSPARPLYLVTAVAYMFWLGWGQTMIIAAISHDNRTIGRLVHMYTYFMIPVSGAFFQVEWIPHPYREYLELVPFPHIFEMARYGQFESATAEYFDIYYLTGWCMLISVVGLLALRVTRRRIHLH